MITAFSVRESERTAEAMLKKLIDHGHIDEDGMFSIPLEDWEIDLLSCYGAQDADLEDSDDDEDEAVIKNA